MTAHFPGTRFSPRFSPRSLDTLRLLVMVVLAALAILLLGSSARGQDYPAPSPFLSTVFPPGGQVGTSVEVTVDGADLDGAEKLYFSHPGLRAEFLPPPPPPPEDPKDKKKKTPTIDPARKFRVTIGADVPVGVHDIRAIGKGGITNPRAFVVGDLPEILETEKNDDVPDAQPISINSTINGVIRDKIDVDYFRFEGKADQRVVAHLAASSIDSRLSPFVQVFTESGRQLGSNRSYRERDAVVDCRLPADGVYFIRVCQFAYQEGGPEYSYRLTLSQRPWIDAVFPTAVRAGEPATVTLFGRNLPDGKPSAKSKVLGRPVEVASQQITPPGQVGVLDFSGRLAARGGSIDGFGVRVRNAHGTSNAALLTFATDPVIIDNNDNDTPETAQPLSLPCVLCGVIEKARDRDYYVFEAKKGDVAVIEGTADRLRAPMEMVLQIRRLDNQQVVGVYDNNSAIPESVDRFFIGTSDPMTRFVAPVDGKYELLVRSHTGDMLAGPRHVYQVHLRKETPDFRLVVVGNHEYGAGLTVRKGGATDLSVVCFRRDGFDGEVELTVDGLPPGVTCPPQRIGRHSTQGTLVLAASGSAGDWAGEIRVKGSANIDGKTVTRDARPGCLVFSPAKNSKLALSRMCRTICMAVRDKGPFRIDAPNEPISVPVGGQAIVKLKIAKQLSIYKENVQITAASGPVTGDGKLIAFPKVAIAPDKEGDVKFTVPAKTEPGQYSLVFRGAGKFDVTDAKKKKKSIPFTASTVPIALEVYDEVAEFVIDPKLDLMAGADFPLKVKVKRLHGYKGELKIEFSPPSGVSGLGTASGTIPAGSDSATLILKPAKDAKPVSNPNFLLRATAKIDNVTLKQETKINVSIADAKGVPPRTGEFKSIKLFDQGAAGWKYAPVGKTKGDGWKNLVFDDQSWKTVRAPFGNGEDAIKQKGGDEIPDVGVSLHCRKSFDVPANLLQSKDAQIRLQVASDNGATVYINGREVDSDEADHEFAYWNRDVVIPADILQPGRNVIAVLLANSAGSSDAYLDAALSIEVPVKTAK